jgi:ketosteroid isomerase-like protein
MRHVFARVMLALLAVVVLGAAGCQSAPPKAPMADTGAMTAALDSLNKAFGAAVAARDTNAIFSNYAADARLMPAGAPMATGDEAIHAAWRGFLAIPGLDLKLASNAPILGEGGDLIIDVGTYTMKMNDAKGKPMQDVGKYVTIFKKVDGQWKIVVDTWNSDAPAPMPAK